MFSEQDECPEPELIQNLSLAMVLKMSAPLFSEAWLAGNVLDPDDIELPTLFNSEGDEIEFIQLHWKLTKGTTQKQLRSLLDAAEDMEPASAKIWNWVATEPVKPKPRTKSTGSVTYKSELEGGALVRGMIELRGKTLEANVNSAERAEQLTKRIQTLLGGLVASPIMVRQTMEQAMAEHRENPTPREQLDLPPDVESQLIKEFYDRHYRETLDQPIPMLGNKTPRDAAKTPKERENVVTWLKHLETGEAKARQNKSMDAYDFSWIWQELGVQELRE